MCLKVSWVFRIMIKFVLAKVEELPCKIKAALPDLCDRPDLSVIIIKAACDYSEIKDAPRAL